jgi:hypothetical protein
MKANIAMLALAGLLIGSPAWAQDTAQKPASRAVLGAGLTIGGDTVIVAPYTDGSSKAIKAGQLFHLYAGLEYQFQGFAVQGNIGYHVDQAFGTNGDVIFGRIPLELIAYKQVSDKFRLGLGLRKAFNAKLDWHVDADKAKYDFGSGLGSIFEAEYLLSDRAGIKLRYVVETYDYAGFEYDGNHVGLMANLYF